MTADASPAPKKKYGAYKHVTLTDEEYNRLCVEYGQDMTEKAIDYLDAYIEEKGYKAKNHNLTLRRWVFKAVQEREDKVTTKKSFARADYDASMDAIKEWARENGGKNDNIGFL